MNKKLLFIFITFSFLKGNAQLSSEGYIHSSEIGIGFGAAHYFGDLNPYEKINRPKTAIGAFYQYYFNNYISARVMGSYAQLGYSDIYSSNPVYRERNLSFNTNIWELTVSGSFHFFNYMPGVSGHNFTPYVSLGAGIFNYNPYAYLNGEKVYLRPLGTEGQNSNGKYAGKKYGSLAGAFPLSLGVKYAVNQKWALFAEAGYRFTTTDYLDDVSTVYAGANAFAPGVYKGSATQAGLALQLQDRSLNGTGVAGMQRGSNTSTTDSYIIGLIGISYNFTNCNCPRVN
ncbi:MAG: DUF6089 family protein [Chitinophagaceae bacterium]|jgi:hypothetical protein|nr:DUF6089 family protein [Chitinophagaceae bacterium]